MKLFLTAVAMGLGLACMGAAAADRDGSGPVAKATARVTRLKGAGYPSRFIAPLARKPVHERGGKVSAPLAYQLFCLKNPAACRANGAASVAETASTMSTLKTVNVSVNSGIKPRTDGKRDRWTMNAAAGDCEDYVLTKRQKLIGMGVPAGSLRVAVGKTRSGEGHAVLVVKTSKGHVVLDNRNNSLRSWKQTGLTLVKVSTANPLKWSTTIR